MKYNLVFMLALSCLSIYSADHSDDEDDVVNSYDHKDSVQRDLVDPNLRLTYFMIGQNYDSKNLGYKTLTINTQKPNPSYSTPQRMVKDGLSFWVCEKHNNYPVTHLLESFAHLKHTSYPSKTIEKLSFVIQIGSKDQTEIVITKSTSDCSFSMSSEKRSIDFSQLYSKIQNAILSKKKCSLTLISRNQAAHSFFEEGARECFNKKILDISSLLIQQNLRNFSDEELIRFLESCGIKFIQRKNT